MEELKPCQCGAIPKRHTKVIMMGNYRDSRYKVMQGRYICPVCKDASDWGEESYDNNIDWSKNAEIWNRRQALLSLREYYSGREAERDAIVDHLNKQPPIDATPVVHGQWIKRDGYTECSRCEYWYDSAENEDAGDRPNYCPNCGSKMDGGEGMRLIDADALDFGRCMFGVVKGVMFTSLSDITYEIESAPAIDPIRAAGGCRCGECKHYNEFRTKRKKQIMRLCCRMGKYDMEYPVKPDDFCSYGEPKEI